MTAGLGVPTSAHDVDGVSLGGGGGGGGERGASVGAHAISVMAAIAAARWILGMVGVALLAPRNGEDAPGFRTNANLSRSLLASRCAEPRARAAARSLQELGRSS